MFEKASSFTPSSSRDYRAPTSAAGDLMIGTARGATGTAATKGGDALRALDWGELTSRLNAARELRLLLQRDNGKTIGTGAASFGDAAAHYFRDQSESERPVNPDALEPRKASQCNVLPNELGDLTGQQGNATKGDARDSE